jgi:hypothetical protein
MKDIEQMDSIPMKVAQIGIILIPHNILILSLKWY